MFTANSMNCIMEVLGMALPYNGTALARPRNATQLARRPSTQLLDLVEEGRHRPADRHPRRPLKTRLRWIWRWAAAPIPCCTCWRSPREAGIEYDLHRHQ